MAYAQSIYKTFNVIERAATTLSTRGRQIANNEPTTKTLKGVLTNASEKDTERYKQRQHPITHTIVQKGLPIAKQEDTLTLGGRKFYVQDVESPGGITAGPGCFTIYQVEERRDK